MMKRTAFVCVTALAMLAACSKPTPPQESADGKAAVASATGPATAPAIDRARMAEGMLSLIDTGPQCQAFRAELEQAGKSVAGPADANDLSQIVVKAHQAGCSTTPKQP